MVTRAHTADENTYTNEWLQKKDTHTTKRDAKMKGKWECFFFVQNVYKEHRYVPSHYRHTDLSWACFLFCVQNPLGNRFLALYVPTHFMIVACSFSYWQSCARCIISVIRNSSNRKSRHKKHRQKKMCTRAGKKQHTHIHTHAHWMWMMKRSKQLMRVQCARLNRQQLVSDAEQMSIRDLCTETRCWLHEPNRRVLRIVKSVRTHRFSVCWNMCMARPLVSKGIKECVCMSETNGERSGAEPNRK